MFESHNNEFNFHCASFFDVVIAIVFLKYYVETCMLLVMITLPYLSLEAFFDNFSVGDVFVCGFFFHKTHIEGRAILRERLKYH